MNIKKWLLPWLTPFIIGVLVAYMLFNGFMTLSNPLTVSANTGLQRVVSYEGLAESVNGTFAMVEFDTTNIEFNITAFVKDSDFVGHSSEFAGLKSYAQVANGDIFELYFNMMGASQAYDGEGAELDGSLVDYELSWLRILSNNYIVNATAEGFGIDLVADYSTMSMSDHKIASLATFDSTGAGWSYVMNDTALTIASYNTYKDLKVAESVRLLSSDAVTEYIDFASIDYNAPQSMDTYTASGYIQLNAPNHATMGGTYLTSYEGFTYEQALNAYTGYSVATVQGDLPLIHGSREYTPEEVEQVHSVINAFPFLIIGGAIVGIALVIDFIFNDGETVSQIIESTFNVIETATEGLAESVVSFIQPFHFYLLIALLLAYIVFMYEPKNKKGKKAGRNKNTLFNDFIKL